MSDTAPLIDNTQFEQIKALMEDEFISLIDAFHSDAATLSTELVTAHSNSDVAGMVRPAHSLKSTAASLGLIRLSDLSEHMEHQCKSSSLPSADDITTLTNCLRDSLAAIDAAL